ncbi:hypothetical protein JEZ13_05735 [bacterium]|nr:hypothetical protein [bacterium]
MEILSLLNTVFIPVVRNGKTFYMFLDSGCPISFSNLINEVTSSDLGIEKDFNHSLQHHNFNNVMESLSKLVGIEVAGILGLDFIGLFDNILINIREEKLEFNLPNFQADFDLDCQILGFISTSISPINPNNDGLTVFDTGAFQCMSFNPIFDHYPISRSWKYVSFMGTMNMDYYNNIELYLKESYKGKHIFGVANNLPELPFDFILGMNFVSEYEVLIDVVNSKLSFKKSKALPILNVHPTHTTGFQIEIQDKIVVSHVRENCPNNVNIGDVIEVDGIDMTQENKVNSIYNTLVYSSSDKPVKAKINGEERELVKIELFE